MKGAKSVESETGATGVEKTRADLVGEGVVVCIRLSERSRVVESCDAVLAGGLRVLEITLTTPGALGTIERFAAKSDALVGGGTVLSVNDVRRVADCGGRFVFSPVFDADVVDAAHELGLLAVPGAATPTEILAAHRYGARIVKVFPSGALGGPTYLRAVRGPLPEVDLLPTSGPTAETLGAYFEAGACAVGVGGELFPASFTPVSVEAAAHRVWAAVQRKSGLTK